MRKFQIYFLSFMLFAYCGASEESVQEVAEDTTTSTTSTSTTSSTTTTTIVEEEKIVDEYGIELIEMGPEMKEQFDELIAFVELRTGLEFTEYPKFQLYTLNGYREYSVASYLDDFEEDYEEGEWERAVLSENMWGLNTATPDELKDLLIEFQRCASSGSYNLVDKILRVPVKKNQKKLNLFEQSVITHELVHSLQGQIIDLAAWYYEMKDADDFSDYYGRRSIMEAQADIIQERWEGGLDSYDRQTLQSQYPAGCGVSLPAYFYIPFDLYYGYGGILGKEIYNKGGMEALNEALYLLPTPEQVYEPEKYFSGEIYDDIEISDLVIEGYSLVDEGKFNSLDLVYLLQGNIGQKQAVDAAVGLNGGSWKDYQDAEGKLFMSVKLNGDNSTELREIYEAFIDWAEAQERFIAYTTADFTGNLFIGEATSFWIENDGEFVRILVAIDQNLLKDTLSNCSSGPCKQDF